MKHTHHQQVLLPPAHRQSLAQQPQPYVVVTSPHAPLVGRRSGAISLQFNFLALIGLFFVFLFVMYLVAMSFAPQLLMDHETLDNRLHLRHSHGAHSTDADIDEPTCIRSLDQERRAKANLVEQVKQLEFELVEEKRKARELEREYRDLALSSRSSQNQIAKVQPIQQMEDISAIQRLSKCRQAVEESTETIRELRDHSKALDIQVTRLQKELREAVADADEQESLKDECERKLKSSKGGSKVPPPPLPND